MLADFVPVAAVEVGVVEIAMILAPELGEGGETFGADVAFPVGGEGDFGGAILSSGFMV